MKPSKQLTVVMLALLVVWAPCNASNTLANEAAREPIPYRAAPGSGGIPMFFEQNAGQSDERVRFVGRGQAYAVLLTDTEAVFKLAPASRDEQGTDVRMQWIGANTHARVVADVPLSGKSNYMLGNDPAAWKTDIPTFGKVKHEEVYPGVDLEFYGKGELLEYDVVVKPGADAHDVRLRFTGTEDVSIDEATGDLVLAVDGGELRHQKAVAYQPTSAGKRPIVSRYTVTPAGDVGFEVGDYDSSQPLVIDPVVTSVQFLGGAQSEDHIVGFTTDSSGGMYLTGSTRSHDFSPVPTAYDNSFNGDVDAFVVKLDSATGSVVYSTYLGSTDGDVGTGIAVDGLGAAYVTGFTQSPMFPTTAGAYQETYTGGDDGFVCKLAPNGSALDYSTFVGGTASDTPTDILVDGIGRATVVGQTTSSDLETLDGAFDRTLSGLSDAFAIRLSATGATLIQATYLGGTGPELATAAAFTVEGDFVLVGETSSFNFPTSIGAFDNSFDGVRPEGFVTRLSAGLNAMTYSTFVGTSGEDRVRDVVVNSSGQASIVGRTSSPDMPVTPNVPQPTFGGGTEPDGFVGRVSADGTVLEYFTYHGGGNFDSCDALAIDQGGALCVSGYTFSADLPTTVGAYDTTLTGNSDALVAKYTPSGQLSFSTFLGGNGGELAVGIGIGAMGSIVVAGDTQSGDFPTTLMNRTGDGFDGFVTVLASDGATLVHSTLVGGILAVGGGTGDEAKSVASAPDGSVYVAGGTTSVNFPGTPGGVDLDTGVGYSGYIVRLDSSGQSLLWSTVIGGSLDDTVDAIARAPDGDVIATGSTFSSDFPTSANCLDSTYAGSTDTFLLRISADGTILRYGTYLGGVGDDYGTSIAIDSTGAAYVTGTTNSTDFPTTPGAYDTTDSGFSYEAFVSKLDSTGSTLLYSTYLGGSNAENGIAIAVDGLGRAAVAGQTNSTDFPTTAGAYSTVHSGAFDLFVTKLNATGTAAVFSTFLGASGSEQPGGIVIDSLDNVIVSGATNSTTFPTTPGAFDTTFNGGFVDGFVTGLNATGSQLAFSTFYGGSDVDVCTGLARDSFGNLWACGWSVSPNLPLSPNAFDSTASGGQDGFVVALDAVCASSSYATVVGGVNNDVIYALSIDANDAVTLVGLTTSQGLAPAGFGADDGLSALIVRLVRAADTPGLYVPSSGAWFPRFVNASGPANLVFTYGAGGSGLVPLAGNWDGTGGDSPGLYDPSTGAFFLRNSSSPGPADLVFTFGPGGSDFVPLAGDWNGDGTDTIGIYSLTSGAFFLRNANAGGPADLVFTFGPGGPGFTPVAGDWNGDGTETIGIYQTSSGAFFLRNANASGGADLVFTFGSGGAGVVPVTGDWNGDGTDTIGVVLQSSGFFFLRDSNSGGPANHAFGYGAGGETPVVGNWAG
ncbi:MAG: SBBP repeat-containing protein [Blastocatellia bacterium]|nr:SBBP repeat-containing protein [Blastocatellia bacterium]